MKNGYTVIIGFFWFQVRNYPRDPKLRSEFLPGSILYSPLLLVEMKKEREEERRSELWNPAKKWNLEPFGKICFGDLSMDYLVLRCSGRKTIALASDLSSLGAEAWTPISSSLVRSPRSKAKIKKDLSILPTFVFLGSDHSIMAFAARDRSLCPKFSLMKIFGFTVRIKDHQLDPIRRSSGLVQALPAFVWPVSGDIVIIKVMPFYGLRARVIKRKGSNLSLALEGSGMVVDIPPFLLTKIEA